MNPAGWGCPSPRPSIVPPVRRLSIIAALLAAGTGLGCGLSDEGDEGGAPQIRVEARDQQAVVKLGFPATATKNTTRVGGADEAADLAGVASAVFPATNDANRPDTVVLARKEDWQDAVAGSVLMADPVNAPMLLSDGDDLPPASRDTLKRLDPKGIDLTQGAAVIRIGDDTPAPEGYKPAVIKGGDPYERAAGIDRFFAAAKGEPSGNVIVTSGEQAEYAMPAAAWAARSGDAVLFARKDELPAPTKSALEAHSKPNIFILGPPSAVGPKVEDELKKLGKVRRIPGGTPVESAVELARYQKGDFGWGLVQPGNNYTLATTTRPADAGASAALAANGIFAPLLLTDDGDELPSALENYFLDVQPGFDKEPTPETNVFNHVWLLGDDNAISVALQGRIDEITQLVPVETEGDQQDQGRPPPDGGGGKKDDGGGKDRGGKDRGGGSGKDSSQSRQ